ncbi:MAG: hypothetical protein IH592_16025 [Bacteroidales bacterium]|nr:hypothetical protein [Bacteroidales bacterium]
MRTDIHVGIFDVIIFLGVFQGLLISWFFIKSSGGNRKANLFQGLLLLGISGGVNLGHPCHQSGDEWRQFQYRIEIHQKA